MKTDTHQCDECQKLLRADHKAGARFCCAACRINWRNRRMSRGADLYDAFMALRFDREDAVAHGMDVLMKRMAAGWIKEDEEAGRKSYFPARTTMDRHSDYFGLPD